MDKNLIITNTKKKNSPSFTDIESFSNSFLDGSFSDLIRSVYRTAPLVAKNGIGIELILGLNLIGFVKNFLKIFDRFF